MKVRFATLLFACSGIYANAYALPAVIDNSAYPTTSAAPLNVPPSPSTNSMFEVMGRLEQLQAEVQQLTGKVEEQANTISELKKQQGKRYDDVDERLQSLETKVDSASQPAPETLPAPEAASGTTDAAPVAAPVVETPASSEPAPAAEPAPAEKPPAPKVEEPQASNAEKQEYYQSYNELRNGHTAESITAFKAYLNKYPTGGYASNAQYWLGEAHRVNQDDASAQTAFNAVIEKYPTSAKVPDALLKLGYIEIDKNNTAQAKAYLTRVTTDFPNTAAARLATKKLLLLNATNH